MARQKHKPRRTCVVCRGTTEKRDLIRVVRTPEGQIRVDPTGKANGRGAYLCQNPKCWKIGLGQQNILGRALKVTISDEDVAVLRYYLETELSKKVKV